MRIARCHVLVLIGCLVAAVGAPSAALADGGPGELDTSFGSGGLVAISDFGTPTRAGRMALQADGKIVSVGETVSEDWAISRFNSDGTPDSSFSGDGLQTLNMGGSESATDVAIQSDGKLVVIGWATDAGHDVFAVARYTADGTLDTSFSGDGIQTTGFGGVGASASAVALQGDGKVVVVGVANGDYALARYNSDGTPDGTFGNGGTKTTNLGNAVEGATAVGVQPDGKLVVTGLAGEVAEEPDDFLVLRYTADGVLDPSFSGDGVQITTWDDDSDALDVALQPDGKIVVVGDAFSNADGGTFDFGVVRYLPNGTPDSSFSDDGQTSINFGDDNDDFPTAVALQADGGIVIAGGTLDVDHTFALARLTPDGLLDSEFSGDGRVTTVFAGSAHVYGVGIQSDGKIVAAGNLIPSVPGNDQLAMARYEGGASVISADDFNWSGLGSNPLGPWSESSNWVGGTAPTSGASIDTLTFPALSDVDCPMPIPTHACNTSNNDLGPVRVDHLVFGTGEDYQLSGSALSLGGGGLAVGASTVHLELPIALTASQTWDIVTDGIADARGLSGTSADLTVSLSDFSRLTLTGDNELGEVSVSTDSPDAALLSLLGSTGQPARLNATSGHGLSLQQGVELEAINAVTGALVSQRALVDVGPMAGATPPGTLSTTSASFGAGGDVRFRIADVGATAGTDYGQLRSTGNVALGGAALSVPTIGPSFECFDLPLGQTYTLITTTGSLSGTFGNAPEGSTILDDEGGCASTFFRINYHKSGPVQTVTATVVPTVDPGQAPLNLGLPAMTGTPAVGVMLTSSTGSWDGDEPIAYAFQWLRDGLPILGATASSYVVQSTDQGHQLAVQVTASNAIGSASATSAALSVPVVVPPPTPDDRRPSDPLPPQPPASPRAGTASVGRVSVQGSSVLLQLACSAGGSCGKVTATLSVLEQMRRGNVVAIASRKRLGTRTVVVGSAAIGLLAGQRMTLRVGLNRQGRALLRRFGKLKATLRVAQGGRAVKMRGVAFH